VKQLESPRPRRRPSAWSEPPWPIARVEPLPPPEARRADLFRAFAGRRSQRPSKAVSTEDLSVLLWHVAKDRQIAERGVRALPWRHRGVPSAGGCHPVDLILFGAPNTPHQWVRYDAYEHCLQVLLPVDPDAARELAAVARDAAGAVGGTIIWSVLHPGRTASRYLSPETLVWRDAGVVQGALSALASGLGLFATMVGPSGGTLVRDAFGVAGTVGGGGVIVGRA
jgi:hypothetical protein